MDTITLTTIVKAIVSEQKLIVGPLAVDQANKVSGVHVNSDLSQIDISGEAKQILSNLVAQYEKLFGQASIEACKESIREVGAPIPPKDLPVILQ